MVIKDVKPRAIYVYLPSREQADMWKELAKKGKVSISRFVADHVENSLSQESAEDYEPRAELRKRIRAFEDENKELRRQNRILEDAVDKLEKENRRYREKQWLDLDSKGMAEFEPKLIDILRSNSPLTDDQLLQGLGVEPRDADSVSSISNQLAVLQSFGLIRSTSKGWRWVE